MYIYSIFLITMVKILNTLELFHHGNVIIYNLADYYSSIIRYIRTAHIEENHRNNLLID